MATITNYSTNPCSSVAGTNNFGGAGSGRVTGLTGFPDRTTGFRFVGSSDATHAKSDTLVLNTVYTFSAYIKPEYTGTLQVNINWYQNGSYHSTTNGSVVSTTNGTVERRSVTGTSPNVAGTIQGLLNLASKSGTVVTSQVLYTIGSTVESYGDGDSPGGTWLGTTGLSASTYTINNVTNVFPTAAGITWSANDPTITRVSSSPTAEPAAFTWAAVDPTVRVIGEGPPLDLPPANPEPVWTLYVRNADLGREAQIDDYTTLNAIVRFNDVGTWELKLDRRAAAADALVQPGAGIEIRRDDFVILTGPVTRVKRDRSDRINALTVSGVDDNVWLQRRLAHPQPASTAPPYSTSADDVRTGAGSTVIWEYVNVNLGPGAISTRELPTLTMATDPEVGADVTGRARYDELLELIKGLAVAGGDLGFKISQDGAGLVFSVYEPDDKSTSVVFSEGFGNLSAFTYEQTAPTYTYVYGGGEGEGTARTIVEGQDSTAVAAWGRIEKLVDAREKEDGPEVSQQIATALAENAEKLSLEITPVDTTNLKYGEHYQLGDIVSVVVDGVVLTDIVRQVEIKLSPQGPQELVPVLGTPGQKDLIALFTAVRDLAARTRNLERR